MTRVPQPLAASAPVRHAVSRVIASYFLLHLREEMKKTDEVLYEDHPDLPIRDLTQQLVNRVRREFPIPEDEPLPSDNLFKRWIELNGKWTYEEFGLYGYNQIYLYRLLDLRDGTAESQKQYFDTMRNRFSHFDYEKQGFTVSFFLNSESNMR